MSARRVVFSDYMELDFTGNMATKAITMGPLHRDHPGQQQLAVASIDGELAVFGSRPRPWLRASRLGSVSVLTCGRLLHTATTYLLAICAEGMGFVFDCSEVPLPVDDAGMEPVQIEPMLAVYLPSNIKTGVVADVDHDGQVELVLGTGDRSVSVFRMQQTGDDDWELVQVTQWYLPGQVDSLANAGCGDSHTCIIGSQPDGLFFSLSTSTHRATKHSDTGTVLTTVPPEGAAVEEEDKEEAAGVDTHVCSLSVVDKETGIRRLSNRVGVCTFDGVLRLQDTAGEILWATVVDRRLLGLASVPLTRADDVLVACAWDGVLYFVDAEFNHVVCDMGERVCAFSAGLYTRPGDHAPSPVVVMVSFTDKIRIYDVSLPTIGRDRLHWPQDQRQGTEGLRAALARACTTQAHGDGEATVAE